MLVGPISGTISALVAGALAVAGITTAAALIVPIVAVIASVGVAAAPAIILNMIYKLLKTKEAAPAAKTAPAPAAKTAPAPAAKTAPAK